MSPIFHSFLFVENFHNEGKDIFKAFPKFDD